MQCALALLSQSKLPMSYWSYAVSTAAHLINKLPTPNLGNQLPWETLYHVSPDLTYLKHLVVSVSHCLHPTLHTNNFLKPLLVFLLVIPLILRVTIALILLQIESIPLDMFFSMKQSFLVSNIPMSIHLNLQILHLLTLGSISYSYSVLAVITPWLSPHLLVSLVQ